jgi:predicted HicB family RNase H-like nuclease
MATKKKPIRRAFVRLDISREDHQALRLAAARAAVSMAEFARQAVVAAAKRVNGEAKS